MHENLILYSLDVTVTGKMTLTLFIAHEGYFDFYCLCAKINEQYTCIKVFLKSHLLTSTISQTNQTTVPHQINDKEKE